MSVEPEQPELSPADLVLTSMPPADPGADTADRYDWQAAVATADGLSLFRRALGPDGRLDRTRDAQVLCEHFEDWCCVEADDAELVSAKHRDPSAGSYTTVAQLAGEGGMRHLFNRWRSLDGRPSCRLVTNAGLSPGPPQRLVSLCAAVRAATAAGEPLSADDETDADLLERIAEWLVNESVGDAGSGPQQARRSARRPPTRSEVDEVIRFLGALRIDQGLPSRDHIGFAAPSMYAQPVIDAMELSGVSAEALWEGVHALFRTRMRARGPIPGGGLPAVLAHVPSADGQVVTELDRYLAARAVTLSDIDVVIQTVATHPAAFVPLRPLVRASRVAIKMTRGGCTPNAVERAEQLRLDYQRYWRDRSNVDSTARSHQDRLRRLLLRASDRATTRVRQGEAAWGAEMWRHLEAEVDALADADRPRDMDPDLILGGLCDLANRCKVWFSDPFDVATELARLRETPP